MARKQKKAVWEKPVPMTAKHTHLSAAKKKSAKAAARRAGRHYPNLVDNMRAAKQSPKKSKQTKSKQTKSKQKKSKRREST